METIIYHHGIKGQKWGIRLFQNKDGSLTQKGRKRYRPNKTDEAMFGKKGAQRVANRRNKGDSRSMALAKEVGRMFATRIVGGTAFGLTLGAIVTGRASQMAKRAISVGKGIVSIYNNAAVVDSTGKVLYRYRDEANLGRNVVEALARKK